MNNKLTKILDDAKAKERAEALALKKEQNEEIEDSIDDLEEEERDKFVSGMTILT